MSEDQRAYDPTPAALFGDPIAPLPAAVVQIAIDQRAEHGGTPTVPHLVVTTDKFTTDIPIMDVAHLMLAHELADAAYPTNPATLPLSRTTHADPDDADPRFQPIPTGHPGGPIATIENIEDPATYITTPFLVLKSERQTIHVALSTVLEALDVAIARAMPVSHPRKPLSSRWTLCEGPIVTPDHPANSTERPDHD